MASVLKCALLCCLVCSGLLLHMACDRKTGTPRISGLKNASLCRCLPAIISAGQDTVPNRTPEALAELPAASLNALTILLETWHRISENSAANGMDSRALAVAVTPCLAWNPPIGKEARKASL